MTLFELESAATSRLGKFIAFVHLPFATHQRIAKKWYFSIMLPQILNLISHLDGAVVSENAKLS